MSLFLNFCSAAMASKMDKGKINSKALVLKSESTIAISLISSVDLANRFSPFSQNYQFLIPVL
jgi:hypothetical protein